MLLRGVLPPEEACPVSAAYFGVSSLTLLHSVPSAPIPVKQERTMHNKKHARNAWLYAPRTSSAAASPYFCATMIPNHVALFHEQSTQELLNAFLSLSVETYPTLTFVSNLHLALAIIKAAGLLSVEDHDWDLETAGANIDLAETLQILSDRCSTGSRATSYSSTILSSRQRMVAAYAEIYSGIRSWYLSKIGLTNTAPDASMPMMMDPVFLQESGMAEEYDFWQHLSGLPYGNLSNV
ncbi:hypothetical protein Landi51_01268 [Colletotrichum acutatum]